MATAAGNKKIAAKLKEEFGVDEYGRSIFHVGIGSLGGENSRGGGYFKTLKAQNPDKLKTIATKGGKTKRAKNQPHTSPETSNDSFRPVAQATSSSEVPPV